MSGRRYGGVLAVGGAFALGGASRAGGQLVLPAPGPAVVRRAPAWRLDVDGGGGYESNVRFQRADGDGDIVQRLRADGGVAWVGRTSLALTGGGDLALYQTLRDLNRVNYAAGLALTRAATPRLTTGLTLGASSSLTPELTQGGVALPLAPLTSTTTRTGAGALDWRFSPRSTGTLDAHARQVRYGSTLLAGGTSAGLDAAVQRRASAHATLAVELETERTAMNGLTYLAETAAGSWTLARGPVGARLRVGGLAVQARGAADVVQPVADVELSRRVRRVTATVRGGRTVTPTLGLGRVLATEYVGAALERRGLRGTTIRLAADDAVSRDPGATEFRILSRSVNLDVRHPLRGGTWVALGAFLRERDQGGRVSGHGLQLTLGHATRP